MNKPATSKRDIGKPRSPKVAEKRARVRENLIAEGGRRFAKQGIDSVSVEEIIAKVGISRRTFYSFFANKNEIAAAILVPALEEGAHFLSSLADTKPVLPGIVECYQRLWETHGIALMIIASISPAVMPYIDVAHRNFGAAVKSELSRAMAAGELRNQDAGYSFTVLVRTAIPLLKVYADHPEQERLYRESMMALLGRNQVNS